MSEPNSPDYGDRVAPEQEGMRSEQQERLELESEPPMADPARWQASDPDVARETDNAPPGRQVVPPGDGMQTDREADEVAEDAGAHREVGPEQQAVHVGTGEEGTVDEETERYGR